MSVTLILGGARSGKSKRAEDLAKASEKKVVYIATSSNMDDEEWRLRVEQHKQQRPSAWQTVEEELLLSEIIQQQGDVCIIVDCLTLWLSNVMYADLDIEKSTQDLCDALQSSACEVIVVSNEVGMGLVPESKLGRAFRDAQGRLNQAVAHVANHVEFVVAGLPLVMKGKN